MTIVELDKRGLREFLKRRVAVVAFYAGRCLATARLETRLRCRDLGLPVGRVDCDREVVLCGELGVKSLPTLHLYVKGRLLMAVEGYDRTAIDRLMDVAAMLRERRVLEAASRILDAAEAFDLRVDQRALHDVLRRGGKCPLRANVECPCPDLERQVEKHGRCGYGLLRRG